MPPLLGLLVLLSAGALLIIAVGSAAVLHRITHPPRHTFAIALARHTPTSPADVGLNFLEREWLLSDGQPTPAWIIEGQQPAGPVVVITHGWGSSRYGMIDETCVLVRFASAVVSYDLRGQGESPARQCRLGTTEVRDLIGILEQLAGSQPFVLYGNSMGGGICIAAAAERPELVQAVIAACPYRDSMEPIVGHFRTHRVPIWPFYLPIRASLTLGFESRRSFDRARRAAGLKSPLLLLHGSRDRICPLESAQVIAAAAPQCRLVVIEGASHRRLATYDPPRYLAVLSEFFRDLPENPPARSSP